MGNSDQQINWWGYGLKMIIHATPRDLKDIPETIESHDETKLVLIVEGNPIHAILARRRDT